MKIFFLLFAFASCSVCTVCKTDNPIQKIHNSASEENYILLKADSNYCGYVNKRITDLDLHTIIDNDSAYDEMIRGCGVVFEKPDFAKYIVLKQTLTGDSIMSVHHAVKKDSAAGTLIWITSSNQFTPCITRRTTYFIKVERPPDYYTILFQNHKIIHGIHDGKKTVDTVMTEEIPFMRILKADLCLKGSDSRIIDSDSLFDLITGECGFRIHKPDFRYFVIIRNDFGGDCEMSLKHFLITDHQAKTLTWKTYNIWGGCRAGGFQTVWLLIRKPSAGYRIQFKQILTRSRDDYETMHVCGREE